MWWGTKKSCSKKCLFQQFFLCEYKYYELRDSIKGIIFYVATVKSSNFYFANLRTQELKLKDKKRERNYIENIYFCFIQNKCCGSFYNSKKIIFCLLFQARSFQWTDKKHTINSIKKIHWSCVEWNLLSPFFCAHSFNSKLSKKKK